MNLAVLVSALILTAIRVDIFLGQCVFIFIAERAKRAASLSYEPPILKPESLGHLCYARKLNFQHSLFFTK